MGQWYLLPETNASVAKENVDRDGANHVDTENKGEFGAWRHRACSSSD